MGLEQQASTLRFALAVPVLREERFPLPFRGRLNPAAVGKFLEVNNLENKQNPTPPIQLAVSALAAQVSVLFERCCFGLTEPWL